ncbi:MAG: hypothetical protein U5J64_11125 [Halobacteriales archaeon]|nr:hypothetical protein [Halobacteriales archaeon]
MFVDKLKITADDLPNGTRLSPQVTEEDIADGVSLGGGVLEYGLPSDPPEEGKSAIFVADGSGSDAEGDLIYVYNDGGALKSIALAEVTNMTAL